MMKEAYSLKETAELDKHVKAYCGSQLMSGSMVNIDLAIDSIEESLSQLRITRNVINLQKGEARKINKQT